MLKPEISLTVGLATAALVYGIYSNALPTVADIRVGQEADPDVESAEQLATWTAAAAVSAVSLIAKDPNVFVIGGSMVVVMAWWHRHANHVNPLTGLARRAGGEPAMYQPDEAMPEAA